MTRFKNLRTMAKLMFGFGFMALLMGVIGYLAVTRLGTINTLLAGMYERDLLGISQIKDVNTYIAMIGRQTRGVVIETDPVAMEKGRDKVTALWGQVNQALAEAEKTFVTEKGKAQIAKLNETLPQYRSVVDETIRIAMTNDKKSAIATLAKAAALGDTVASTISEASRLKEEFGKNAFEQSGEIYASSRTLMLSIIGVAVLLALGMGYLLANLISKPLNATVGVLQAVSGGDLTQSLDVQTKDEVGDMAQALNVAVDGMRGALTEVRDSADNLASAAQQLASSSEELSSGAQEQASGIEETSASLEQITSSVKQNADSARQANQLAAAARETAEKGGQVVSNAVAAMAEINTSSKKIADIITAIDEIAFQTNLLALNAAVEAARAGEQGRGFAVVAAEVRTLAQRSATAAKEIKALIQDSVRKVEAGSQMVNQSGDVLLEIVSSVARVTDIVGEIAAASREQASSVEQVGKAMSQMDQVTQQNTAQTEELSSTAQSLASSAEQLQMLVTRFQLDNGRKARRGAGQGRPAAGRSGGGRAFTQELRALSQNVPHSGRAAGPVSQPVALPALPDLNDI